MKIGSNHGIELPGHLSRSVDKLRLYATDTYFLESWEDYLAVAEKRNLPPLSEFASLTLKPDAVVGRTIKPTIDWLEEHGFKVVAAEIVEFERHITRGIWQYSWNVASRDRKDIVDVLLTATPSLFLVLHGPEDAALWLSENKGPANPKYRSPGQLRYGLGYFSTLLNFVHTSDEPADFVRELAVYFPAATRQKLYGAMASFIDSRAMADELAGQLEDRFPPHDLEFEASVARLLKRLPAFDGIQTVDLDGLEELLGQIALGESHDWRRLYLEFGELGLSRHDWDLIVVAVGLVRMDNQDIDPLVPGISSMTLPATATEIG